MSDNVAQIILSLMMLAGALVFLKLGDHPLAVAFVAAMAGQGASIGVKKAVNGNGGKK